MKPIPRLILITVGLFVGSVILIWTVSSFATGCSRTITEKWPCGSTVYYSLSGFNATETQGIVNGVALWNNLPNTPHVTYLAANTGHPAMHVFQAGTTDGANDNSAHTAWQFNTETHLIISANTTFYFSERYSNDNSAVWDSTNANTYPVMLKKIAAHEIGHPMGLEHPDLLGGNYCSETDGATIMNGPCGTNDSAGNMPTIHSGL